jgi:hypothetical protein
MSNTRRLGGSGSVRGVTPAEKLKISGFASEEEEAQWWYDHKDKLAKAFEESATSGQLRAGSAARLARERIAGSRTADKPATA